MNTIHKKHRPTSTPEQIASRSKMHTVHGITRDNTQAVRKALLAKKATESMNTKTVMSAYESVFLDEAYPRIEQERQAHPEMYGLGQVRNTENDDVITHVNWQFANNMELNISAHQYTTEPSITNLKSFYKEQDIQNLRREIKRDREQAIEKLRQRMVNINIMHIAQWELEMMQNEREEIETMPCDVVTLYRQYCDYVCENKDGYNKFRDNFLATRKMLAGIGFGTSVQWALVKMHPQFVKKIGEELTPEFTEQLLAAQSEYIEKWAMEHPALFYLFSKDAKRIEDITECTKRETGKVQMHMDPKLLTEACAPMSQAMARAFVAEEKQFDVRPDSVKVIAGCSAYFSRMFQGVQDWIYEITRNELMPQQVFADEEESL